VQTLPRAHAARTRTFSVESSIASNASSTTEDAKEEILKDEARHKEPNSRNPAARTTGELSRGVCKKVRIQVFLKHKGFASNNLAQSF
jgi:hypothetical protein